MKNFFDFILDNADPKKTKTFAELSEILNKNGYRTRNGTKYKKGGRGMGKVVRSAYDAFKNKGEHKKADTIAKAFTNAKGKYAYK